MHPTGIWNLRVTSASQILRIFARLRSFFKGSTDLEMLWKFAPYDCKIEKRSKKFRKKTTLIDEK